MHTLTLTQPAHSPSHFTHTHHMLYIVAKHLIIIILYNTYNTLIPSLHAHINTLPPQSTLPIPARIHTHAHTHLFSPTNSTITIYQPPPHHTPHCYNNIDHAITYNANYYGTIIFTIHEFDCHSVHRLSSCHFLQLKSLNIWRRCRQLQNPPVDCAKAALANDLLDANVSFT